MSVIRLSQPQTTLEWWRQLEAELAAVDRAIEYEHQAAVTAGRPWPPARTPQPEPERMPEPDSSPRSDPQADDQSGPHDRAARLDEMLAQAAEAAQHLAAENAGREARAEYALNSDEKPPQKILRVHLTASLRTSASRLTLRRTSQRS